MDRVSHGVDPAPVSQYKASTAEARTHAGTDLGVVDEAADVVEDDAGLALDLRHLGAEAAADDGHDDGERGGVHVLDEDAGGQVVDGLHRVGRVLERLHEARDDRVEVRVAVRLDKLLERRQGDLAVVVVVGD